ncbi:unnamed protein product [Cladocopium goreaui]|uniref:Uncharacterized protein n=1 Tax=Cladocopium goreaui TaxID=2562237 RepID=A0A9P1BPX0_9DINO|nr:unnamed protein product [Cladocopium goreaui]
MSEMQDLISEDGWTVLDTPILAEGNSNSNAAFKRVGNFFMLRLSTVVKSVLADSSKLSVFPRPEILADRQLTSSLGIEFADFTYTVEEILSPGDIFTSVHLRNSFMDEMNKAGAQVALLTGSSPPEACEEHFRERVVQWRDFPSPGLLTIVEIPFDEKTQTFMSQIGGHFATVSVVQAHPQSPDEMIVTVGLFVTGSAFPLWASAHLAQMAQSVANLVQLTASSFGNLESLCKADQNFYTVLSLRTCPQGRPLLPGACPLALNLGEDPWCVLLDLPEGADPAFTFWFRPVGDFNFPNYLFLFLAAIGCPQVQVFSSIDGRPLVPYQAVVRRSQWLEVNSSFEAAWKVHKMAYRKLNSTKHAPTISEAKTPRFAEVPDSYLDNPPSVPLKSLITVHNTFIEVDDMDGAPAITRTKSC